MYTQVEKTLICPSKPLTLEGWGVVRAKPTLLWANVGVAPPFQGEGDRICVYTVGKRGGVLT